MHIRSPSESASGTRLAPFPTRAQIGGVASERVCCTTLFGQKALTAAADGVTELDRIGNFHVYFWHIPTHREAMRAACRTTRRNQRKEQDHARPNRMGPPKNAGQKMVSCCQRGAWLRFETVSTGPSCGLHMRRAEKARCRRAVSQYAAAQQISCAEPPEHQKRCSAQT